MPQRDVLRGRHGIAANHARQAANLLAAHRISLVRHRRTAALLSAKWLFGFANFCALQVPDLRRNPLKRRREYRERSRIFGVAVSLDHLRRNWRDVEAEFAADFLFDFRP